MAYGVIKRSRSKVSAAAYRSTRRAGKPYPEHHARAFKLNAEVYRRHDGKYQGWVCLGKMTTARRTGEFLCGEAKGGTPTDALAKAARDFARSIKSRERIG